jgi:hypothetical protein
MRVLIAGAGGTIGRPRVRELPPDTSIAGTNAAGDQWLAELAAPTRSILPIEVYAVAAKLRGAQSPEDHASTIASSDEEHRLRTRFSGFLDE